MTAAARAADVVEEAIVDPGVSWTGFYAGVNAGYSWGDLDHMLDVVPADPVFLSGLSVAYGADADGASGGAQAGFNWQMNNFVFGVEADIQAAGIDGEVLASELYKANPNVPTVRIDLTASTKVDWFGTARLRAGFLPTERLLVYGTGGFAFGRTTSTVGFSTIPAIVGGGSTSEATDRTGWAAGAGTEFAIDDNWSIKGEYLYTDLGEEDIFSSTGADFAATLSSDVKFHTVRIGLNYGF